jgi:hypothetical protein
LFQVINYSFTDKVSNIVRIYMLTFCYKYLITASTGTSGCSSINNEMATVSSAGMAMVSTVEWLRITSRTSRSCCTGHGINSRTAGVVSTAEWPWLQCQLQNSGRSSVRTAAAAAQLAASTVVAVGLASPPLFCGTSSSGTASTSNGGGGGSGGVRAFQVSVVAIVLTQVIHYTVGMLKGFSGVSTTTLVD